MQELGVRLCAWCRQAGRAQAGKAGRARGIFCGRDLSRKMTHSSQASGRSYEDAIDALNSLQSNAAYLKGAVEATLPTQSDRFLITRQYAEMVGLSTRELSKLSVLHVAGTKGKGSTSAYCESILRHNGYHTGFFSSPHLVSVTERIQIDGTPLSLQKFTSYFWSIFDEFQEKKGNLGMPPYFAFLTLMAFRVFLEEHVDVAVIEVGIGGEYDSTNLLQDVSVAGITSLGLDHTSLLGNTIASIAWQKAGILKPSAVCFTVPGHPPEAQKILGERSVERECPVEIVPSLQQYEWPDPKSRETALSLFWTQQINASLALQMTNAWIRRNVIKKSMASLTFKEAVAFPISQKTCAGLLECRWPGRNQILKSDEGHVKYFLDGAHTAGSMGACVEWYKKNRVISPGVKQALLFNMTGDRDRLQVMEPLLSCAFDKVIFSPNIVQTLSQGDLLNARVSPNSQLKQTQALCDLWTSMIFNQNHESNCTSSSLSEIFVVTSVNDAIRRIEDDGMEWSVLVTGSLHLVGAVLSVIDPNLEK